jgi:hypothetical protein
MTVLNVPVNQRNPYTIWFSPKYANQKLSLYNRIAAKYHMARLLAPLNIN